MSQRLITTVSSINSAGMPIFQASGLVPLHNTVYSVSPVPSHPKTSQPYGSGIAVSSSGLLEVRPMDVAGLKPFKSEEVPGLSLTGSTPLTGSLLTGSSALAQLLQMNSRNTDVKSERNRGYVLHSADRRIDVLAENKDDSLGTKTGEHKSQTVTKPAASMNYPSVDFHSTTSAGGRVAPGWLSHESAGVFKAVSNIQIVPDTDSKRTDEVGVRTEEHGVGLDEAVKRSRGAKQVEVSSNQSKVVIKKDCDSDYAKQEFDTKDWQNRKLEKGDDEEDCGEEWVPMDTNPFNMRIVNLNNFPTVQSVYRTNYRSHSVACVRAKLGSIQNTAKSLDLLRQILQKSINAEIDVILKKYVEEFIQPALENIRLNNGDNAVSVEHVNNVCRQILEEAKKMFNSDIRSVSPDIPDNASDSGSTDDARNCRPGRSLIPSRKRRPSSGSESSSSALKTTKKKGRFGSHLQASSGRSTPSKKSEPVRREGPLWDSERIKADTLFVMGARANKALGLGATRGRLYIKHPEIFKYSGDQDDKQWLYEKHLMPATGGKTYLLLVDDIKELAQSDEYRNSPGLLLDELVGFTAPEWMLEKMRTQMNAMRTDTYKVSRLIRESAATESLPQPSPANSETQEMSAEQDYEDDSAAVSLINEPAALNPEPSPAPSQVLSELTNADESDDDGPLTGEFYTEYSA